MILDAEPVSIPVVSISKVKRGSPSLFKITGLISSSFTTAISLILIVCSLFKPITKFSNSSSDPTDN